MWCNNSTSREQAEERLESEAGLFIYKYMATEYKVATKDKDFFLVKEFTYYLHDFSNYTEYKKNKAKDVLVCPKCKTCYWNTEAEKRCDH